MTANISTSRHNMIRNIYATTIDVPNEIINKLFVETPNIHYIVIYIDSSTNKDVQFFTGVGGYHVYIPTGWLKVNYPEFYEEVIIAAVGGAL